jgi:hypothetical protein
MGKILLIFVMVMGLTASALGFEKTADITTNFRCRNSVLVSTGQYQGWVMKKCGEPTYTDIDPEEAGTAIWTYDMGPGHYTYILFFEATRLIRIEVDKSFK